MRELENRESMGHPMTWKAYLRTHQLQLSIIIIIIITTINGGSLFLSLHEEFTVFKRGIGPKFV